MSDDVPPIPPIPAIKPPQYPEGHVFPDDVLRAWVDIPSGEPMAIGPLTKGALDQFLFGFGDLVIAIADLRQGLIEFSNGRIEHATAHLQNALNRNIDAETKNRFLFEAIMRSALEVRKNAGK